MPKIQLSVLLLSLALIFTACDAPRNNPVDTGSDLGSLPLIKGNIRATGTSVTPVSGALLNFIPTGNFTTTDADGNFNLQVPLKKEGWLIISKTGFKTDSIFISWSNGKLAEVKKELLKFPEIKTFSVTSSVIRRFPDLKFTSFKFFVELVDSYQGLDSVVVTNNASAVSISLDPGPGGRQFLREIFSFQSPGLVSPNSLIGQEFKASFHTGGEVYTSSLNRNVTRIIDEEIKFISPANNVGYPNPVSLSWQAFNPGFNHTYTVEILLDDITPLTVWKKEGIPSGTTRAEVDVPLPSGGYIWVIYCVDEFGNTSRSKPASFLVR